MVRQQQRREATTENLIAQARRLFTTTGYAGTSLDAVAQAAGVTKGALYHHFGSKAGLFRAVLTEVQREVADGVAAAAEAEPKPWNQLLAGCEAFLAASSDPDAQRIMLVDGPSVLGWHEWRAIDEASSARHLNEALELLIAKGDLPDQPAEPLAHLLSGAMNETALWLAQSDNRDTDLARAMTALTRMLEGLRLPESARRSLPSGLRRQ